MVPQRPRVRREREFDPQQEEQLHLRLEPPLKRGPAVQPERQADPGAEADTGRSEKYVFGSFRNELRWGFALERIGQRFGSGGSGFVKVVEKSGPGVSFEASRL